jgi:tetratricopeptide (TPR) repeat protein
MMADPMPSAEPMPTANAGAFLGTFAVMSAAIAGLLVFDLFLARIERRESAAHAANEYADGVSLLAQHRPSDAADRFSAAVSINRSNTTYALGLAEAQLEGGHVADAESTLHDLLERAENDGAVNLVMARTLLRSGREEEAKAYYHRAIYGRWGPDSTARRREARFELIALLARRGSRPELLAELLPLDEAPPDSVALHERIANLFITAGSPARAASSFRQLLRRDPKNADAYAGVGDAEMALGNFRAARADFAEARRLRPGDSSFAAKSLVADSAFALDPTARGIGSAERLTRSRLLLERTLSVTVLCGQMTPLTTSARRLLGTNVTDAGRDAAVDSMVEMATSLWSARPGSCANTDRVLSLLQLRLAQ